MLLRISKQTYDTPISLALDEPKLEKTLHRINPFAHDLDDFYYKPQLDSTVRQLSSITPTDRDIVQDILSQRVQEICLRQIVRPR